MAGEQCAYALHCMDDIGRQLGAWRKKLGTL